jgi:drug/metabolite transporter (DMT)-like permease
VNALLFAGLAILMWSFNALLAHTLGQHHTLLLAGLGLSIGGALTIPQWRRWAVPPGTLAIGIGGMLGYHALYFLALSGADPVPINLVNYLWPLLMVVLAPLIIGGRWRAGHVLGVLLGVAGMVLLLAPAAGFSGSPHPWSSFLAAGLAALVWALYSLATKAVRPFPSAAVGGFCLAAGLGALLLAFAVHGGAEVARDLASISGHEWLLLLVMGLGPLGAAFLCWDAALKRGDPRMLAACAYIAPLLSTCWLLVATGGRFDGRLWGALACITAGAALASWTSSRPERSSSATPAPVAAAG